MGTTIRSAISSPSASVNNPRLAYIWMYVCWGVHPDTYPDIWVRRVIISACHDSCYDPCYACYDSWYDSCYDSRYDTCIGLLLWCLLWFLLWLPLCTPVMPVMCSRYGYLVTCDCMCLITMIWDKGIWMRVSLFGLFPRRTSLMEAWPKLVQSVLLVIGFPILWWLWYTCSCLLYLCSNPCFLNLISFVLDIISTCAHPSSPPGFCIILAWGVSSDSPGFSCPGFGAWSVWILPVADQSGAAVAWISSVPSRVTSFRAPCVLLEFPCRELMSAFHTVYSCIFLVLSQLRLSGDVILL